MKRHKRFTVAVRRKREGKTNYKKRLRVLLSEKPRLLVRTSSKNVLGQVVDYEDQGDRVIASASSKELEKMGWKYARGNLPSAYLVGFLTAKKAQMKKVKEVVFDIGMRPPITGSRVFAFLKGAVDAGLSLPHSEEVFPPEDRVRGKHIADYAQNLKKEDKARYEKQFAGCLKNKAEPEDIEKQFDAIKKKIEALK